MKNKLELQEVLKRNLLCGNLKQVISCYEAGADLSFENEYALEMAVYIGSQRLVKFLTQQLSCKNIDKLIDLSEKLGQDKITAILQDKRLVL